MHSLGNAIKVLLENNIREGITERHVEEALRIDAPLHMFTRYALEDLDYNGIRLKKGETVGLMLGAANRDPARFANPESSTPRATPIPMSASALVFTSASAHPWRGWKWKWRCRCCLRGCRSCSWREHQHYKDAYHFHGLGGSQHRDRDLISGTHSAVVSSQYEAPLLSPRPAAIGLAAAGALACATSLHTGAGAIRRGSKSLGHGLSAGRIASGH